jgi:regulatory protein
MVITEIRTQQRRADRVSVYVDGRFALGLDRELLRESGLAAGQEISAERLGELSRQGETRRALAAALSLLEKQGRSVDDVTRKLTRRGFGSEPVAAAVRRLIELGLLNDAAYAAALARDRLEIGRKGRHRIRADLRRKGVSGSVIEQALARAGDETAAARALLAKVDRRYAGLEARSRYRKLRELLLRRGFGFDTVSRVLGELERSAAEEELRL